MAKVNKNEVDTETKYKLNLYTPNGLLKPEIPRHVFTIMSTKYGDIIRSISGYQWMTITEIVQSYQNLSKRLRFEPNRNEDQIKEAVRELIEASMVLSK